MKRTHRQARSGKLQRRNLAVETLEDRRLLAVLTNLFDSVGNLAGTEFVPLEGATYFINPVGGPEGGPSHGLWRTDGTSQGTTLVKGDSLHTNPFLYRNRLVAISGKLYFTANESNDFRELWVSDGTSEGTRRIKDIFLTQSDPGPLGITEFMGDAYFVTLDENSQQEVWKTNGTEEGTVPVTDLDVDPIARVRILGEANGRLLFANHFRLWSTDGTELGTEQILEDAQPTGDGVTIVKDFYFIRNGPNGYSLWKTDGSRDGTTRVYENVAPSITALNDNVYFTSSNRRQLWRTDGTPGSATLVKDFGSDCVGNPFAHLGNALFIEVFPECGGYGEFWKTDGTEVGTVRLGQVLVGNSLGATVNLYGSLFFTGISDDTGSELWRSDGTDAGTMIACDIAAGVDSGTPIRISKSNGALYFWSGQSAWSLRPDAGDTDFDGRVDLIDLNNVRNNFGYVGDDRPGDLTGDGAVDLEDLNEVRNHFGEGATSATVAPSAQVVVSTPPTAARDQALETLMWLRSSQGPESNSFDALPIGGVRNIGRSQRSYSR